MEHIDNCWYKDVCSKPDTDCNFCIRYKEMSALMEQSNIPLKKQYPDALYPDVCDVKSFERLSHIKRHIVEFVNSGNNLYITSNITGNGKTSWSIKLLLKYFNDVWPGNGFKCRGIFMYVPTFLLKSKDFNNIDTEFQKLKGLLSSVDLVVWDDIASTDMSSYDYSQLLSIIDQRCLNGLSNIFTGNLMGSSLEKKLGAKLYSRIEQNSEVIILRGADNRNGIITNNI